MTHITAAPLPALIELSGAVKTYRKGSEQVSIFDGLDLRFDEGEFVAVMGPSGSGKTTLLNLLGGIDTIDGGDIRFQGASIRDRGDAWLTRWRAAHVGFVFQFYNLMPYLTAAQNVELPLLLTPLGAKERRHRAALALDLVGLSDRSRHRPGELSGGQQQRVAIARALVTDPELILADEPTGDLDRATADEVLDMLDQISRVIGKTVVMVTHDPRAAERARRVLHLDKGQLVTRPELVR
ncbi:ABC transporter ATP-binding protein [Sphingomonas sp. Leaf33]|nr:ABC transporter ATP-binding protein [Sphingomonas sp. Leaf33]